MIAPATASNWPAHVFAPYVDMTLYPTYNLVTAMQTAGIKYFTLAFITADSNNAPAWGGYTHVRGQRRGLRPVDPDADQPGSARWAATSASRSAAKRARSWRRSITNVQTLTAAYQQVITAYGLTHIDFDIEGAAVADDASIDRRSQAIAALQQAATAAGKTLDVSFTLPVLPTGLTANGLYVLQSALKYGVKISTVNVMAMDYRRQRGTQPGRADGHLRHRLGQEHLHAVARSLRHDAHHQPALGDGRRHADDRRQRPSDEVFGFSDASQLLAFAESVGMGEIAMWSLGRDQEDPAGALTYAEDDSSSLVQTPFEFSDIFNAFTGYA